MTEKKGLTEKRILFVLLFVLAFFASFMVAEKVNAAEPVYGIPIIVVANDEEIPVPTFKVDVEVDEIDSVDYQTDVTDENGICYFSDIQNGHDYYLDPRTAWSYRIKTKPVEYYKRDENGNWAKISRKEAIAPVKIADSRQDVIDGKVTTEPMYKIKVYTEKTMDILAKIDWNDYKDFNGERPKSIELVLMSNEEEVRCITVDAQASEDWEDTWYGLFKGLPVLDKDNHWITYRLKPIDPFGNYNVEIKYDENDPDESIYLIFNYTGDFDERDQQQEVTIEARKMMDGKPAKGSDYTFALIEGENHIVAETKNKDDIIEFKVTIDAKDFKDGETANSYEYLMVEYEKGDDGVIYDKTIFEVDVYSYIDESDGYKLKSDILYRGPDENGWLVDYNDGELPVFHNKTDRGKSVKSPNTGDMRGMKLMLIEFVASGVAMIAMVSIRFIRRRYRVK